MPAGVDYEMWIGPAPRRMFNPNRYNRTWRCYRDYGNGDIGDDGVHDLDMARWALKETTHPVRITAHGTKTDLEGDFEFPDNMTVSYEYADKKVLLYEDRQWTPYGVHGVDCGNEFYGTKGYMVFSRRGFFRVFLGSKDGKGNEEAGPEMGKPGRVSQPAPDHMANFLGCVQTRKEPNAPVADAHLSSSLVHLGEIASRLGRTLRFDPKQESFVQDAQANAMLSKDYRDSWKLTEG